MATEGHQRQQASRDRQGVELGMGRLYTRCRSHRTLWFCSQIERASVMDLLLYAGTSGQLNLWSHFFLLLFFNLTYSRWTLPLPSCLWSLRIFPSHPGSRLTFFYRDANSALLQLANQWLNFTYSRFHAFRYERKNTNPTLVRIELTTSALAGVQVTY